MEAAIIEDVGFGVQGLATGKGILYRVIVISGCISG